MVAPSFQSMNILCEPYAVSGKMYVKVENPKTKNVRQVRWYSEQEYRKAYGNKDNSNIVSSKTADFNYKKILGFDKGYITIFKNDPELDNEWFRRSAARYHIVWGWYFVSTEEIPADLPKEYQPVRLEWSEVSTEDGQMRSDTEIRRYVETLIYPQFESNFIGQLGERLSLTLTLIKDYQFDNGYGNAHIYEFVDGDGNYFTWTTNAKILTVGSTYDLKGTVKDFKTYKGKNQTQLTRCIIQKGK